jgi:predicted DNA-binding ribbon-helix-helix protein
MSRGTTKRNVRIDDARWAALEQIAKDEGTDRSTVLRDLIDERIARHEATD